MLQTYFSTSNRSPTPYLFLYNSQTITSIYAYSEYDRRMILNPVEILFLFMQHITLDCHKYHSLQKSCYIAQNRVHPRKSQLKREVRSKRKQSSHVTYTCCVHKHLTCTLWYVHCVIPCMVHISIHMEVCLLYESMCAYD